MSDEARIKRAFDVTDIEQEGRIPSSELENTLLIAKMNVTSSDVAVVLEQLGNPATIDYDQFKEIVEELGKKDQVEDLKEAFRMFDKKKVGYIMPDVLKEIIKPMLDVDLSEAELDEIIQAADKDGDGTIDIDEFVEFMMADPAD